MSTIELLTDIINTDMCMMSILNMKEITSFLNVVGTTKEHINFFKGDLLGFGNAKPDEDGQTDVDGEEEIEGFARKVLAKLF